LLILSHSKITAAMTDFFYGLADLFYATFEIMPLAGPTINLAIMIIIAVLFLYWMGQLMKFRSQGGLE
jgi:hypothetical protein